MLLYSDLAALDMTSVVNMRYKFLWSVHRLSIFNVQSRKGGGLHICVCMIVSFGFVLLCIVLSFIAI